MKDSHVKIYRSIFNVGLPLACVAAVFTKAEVVRDVAYVVAWGYSIAVLAFIAIDLFMSFCLVAVGLAGLEGDDWKTLRDSWSDRFRFWPVVIFVGSMGCAIAAMAHAGRTSFAVWLVAETLLVFAAAALFGWLADRAEMGFIRKLEGGGACVRVEGKKGIWRVCGRGSDGWQCERLGTGEKLARPATELRLVGSVDLLND